MLKYIYSKYIYKKMRTTQVLFDSLQHGKFAFSKQILETTMEVQGPEHLKLLSLLYRLFDEYDQESALIEYAISKYGITKYFSERKAWHDQPLLTKLVPRKPIKNGRFEQLQPIPEILEKMCFVTALDSNYFIFLVSCIESLRHTKHYKDIPICILDCGLTEEHKHYLQTKYGINNIKDPGWDTLIPDNKPQTKNIWEKGVMARSYLQKHFPQFRYHFFLDPDLWIQDETCLHTYVNMCKKYGVGLTPNNEKKYVKEIPQDWHTDMVPEVLARNKELPAICGGATLWDSMHSFMKDVSHFQTEILQEFGWVRCADEMALYDAMFRNNILHPDQLVPDEVHTLSYQSYYLNDAFHGIRFNHLIGLFHLQVNKALFQPIWNRETKTKETRSVLYLDFPWNDKEEIKHLIQQAINLD